MATFLFVCNNDDNNDANTTPFCKLRKIGRGGLACAFNNPDQGIHFGPGGLMILLCAGPGGERSALSNLGPYYKQEPDGTLSLFLPGVTTKLAELRMLVGV